MRERSSAAASGPSSRSAKASCRNWTNSRIQLCRVFAATAGPALSKAVSTIVAAVTSAATRVMASSRRMPPGMIRLPPGIFVVVDMHTSRITGDWLPPILAASAASVFSQPSRALSPPEEVAERPQPITRNAVRISRGRSRIVMKPFLVAAAGLMSGTAFAADLTGVDQPVLTTHPTASTDWTGVYVGLHGGYGWGEAGFDFVDIVPNSESETDINGGFLGIQGGYDHQFGGGFVLGAEGDLAWSEISGSDPCPNRVVYCAAKLDWFGSVRVRAGFGFARVLAYATGGLAVRDAEFDTSGGLAVPGFDKTSFGWTIGGGLEAALRRN